jgi:hypothetical protein
VLILCRAGRNRVIGQVRIRPTDRTFRTWTLPAEHPELAYAQIVHAARGVADTALQCRRFDAVRSLVTSAVQSRRCTVEDLLDEVDACPRQHSALLRLASADLRDGARSIAEAEALEILRRSPVPRFDANVTIVTASGRRVAIVDVLFRELRAVIEIDSRQFHFSATDWDNTRDRHNRLTPYGLALQHYSPAEIRRDAAGWATKVERWLRARAVELGVAYVVPQPRPAAEVHPRPFVVPDLPELPGGRPA